MTPGARVAAAIEVVDAIADGGFPAHVMAAWGRRNRYAGSGDRAAISDHVHDVMRRWWSTAHDGVAATGRGRMIGLLRQTGTDPGALMTGQGHAPAPPGTDEGPPGRPADAATALDCPVAAEAGLRASLGDRFAAVMEAMRHRAPVFLRVNLRRTDVAGALAALASEGIEAVPHPLSPTALRVIGQARRLSTSCAYRDGFVELQDAASQAVVDRLPLCDGMRVLDLCAGGGGKTLAMAGRADARFVASDIAPQRMRDLPARAVRAGVDVTCLDSKALDAAGKFDLVLVDAPCTGSGAWRRDPWGKVTYDATTLARATAAQDEVLLQAVRRTAPDGQLAYVTCSMMGDENEARIAAFRASHSRWHLAQQWRSTPLDGGDGFFMALMHA